MSRKSILPQTPRHIPLYDEDWEFLQSVYGRNSGAKPVGVSTAIRTIIHAFVKKLRERATQVRDGAPLAEGDVPDEADLAEVASEVGDGE